MVRHEIGTIYSIQYTVYIAHSIGLGRYGVLFSDGKSMRRYVLDDLFVTVAILILVVL